MSETVNGLSAFHAALYIRLSREDENDGPSESVTNQNALLQEYAQAHNLSVYDTYIDDGWSGTNFDRPGFRRMIADIEKGNVNLIITKDLSRLGRDYIMTGYYLERYFPEKQVRYISLLDGIDTGTDSSLNDITPFRAIMNDMYARDISRKIRSVKHDKQRRGLFIGGKPVYGYKMHPSEKNRIVIDDEAATVVRNIFRLALDGKSCRKIAESLNEARIPSPAVYAGLPLRKTGPYSGLWSSERISEVLQNETYIGSMVQGRTVKVSYKSKKTVRQDPSDWIVVPDTHEALISPEEFQKVQLLLACRRNTRSRTYDYLLKGMLFCHECGGSMAAVNRKNAAGEDTLYLLCRTYQRFTKAGVCTSHCIREQTVTDVVLDSIHSLITPFQERADLLTYAEQVLSSRTLRMAVGQDVSLLKSRINSCHAKMDRIYQDKLSGLISESDFLRNYRRYEEERNSLLKKLEQAQMKKADVSAEAHAAQLTDTYLNSLYPSRELLVSLIERIDISADGKILIYFRFRDPKAISST